MARPKTPTAIMEARGAFRDHAGRRAEREGEPTELEDLGACPSHLTIEQALAWEEIRADSHKGVLSRADRIALEVAAVLLVELRKKGGGMEAGKIGRLQSALGELGMTPASRAKVKVAPKKAEPSALAQLLNRKRA